MATLADLVAQIEAIPAFANATRARSDILETVLGDHPDRDQEVLQISGVVQRYEVIDSNQTLPLVATTVRYHKFLADAAAEHQWAHVDSFPVQLALADPKLFNDLPAVYLVENAASGEVNVGREGDVVTHSVTWLIVLLYEE